MPIIASDLKMHLSGGAANADPNASLGGARSSSEVGAGLHALFDAVSGAESQAGDVEYRCIYLRNAHGTLPLTNAVVYISSNTPSADSALDIGLGTSAVNGTEQTVANESTAPAGVTFSAAAGVGNALAIGTIAAGQHKALWIRRTINAAAPALNNDTATIAFEGETAE